MTAVLTGLGWALALVAFIGLIIAVNIVRGYRLAGRMLGPASSDPDFDFAVMGLIVDDPTPHGRRHGHV